MFNGHKIAAVIPAKGCSKGVPRKNLKDLYGKPMIEYTMEAAKNSKYIDIISIATEDAEIAELAKKSGLEAVIDPQQPTETNPLDPVYEYNIKELEKRAKYDIDVAILLQPTSPLRNSKHLDEAIEKFFTEKADSLLSVTNSHKFLWKQKNDTAFALNYDYKNRQVRQEKEQEYAENGAIYIIKKDLLYNAHCRLGGKISLYVMENEQSVEVDNQFDFLLIENIMKLKNEKN